MKQQAERGEPARSNRKASRRVVVQAFSPSCFSDSCFARLSHSRVCRQRVRRNRRIRFPSLRWVSQKSSPLVRGFSLGQSPVFQSSSLYRQTKKISVFRNLHLAIFCRLGFKIGLSRDLRACGRQVTGGNWAYPPGPIGGRDLCDTGSSLGRDSTGLRKRVEGSRYKDYRVMICTSGSGNLSGCGRVSATELSTWPIIDLP
jgi:hypothetical protein